MKNLAKLIGIVVIVVFVIGFSFVACDDSSNGDNNNSENTGGNIPGNNNPGGNNPGDNNPDGNNPGDTGSGQSFSFPSQLKNTTWLKDGTTAGYTHVYLHFYTDSYSYSYRETSGSLKYGNSTYVDRADGNTYHTKTGGTFTATVNGNKLTTTSSSWGPTLIGTFTKQ